jgi:hypothetical protein
MYTSTAHSAAPPSSIGRHLAGAFAWCGGKALSWQLVGVGLVWLSIVGLHLHNDGIWYQGDAPRHLTNGLLFLDLLTELPADPKEFALSYYARYPVIHPTAHPPGFYLLEALAFAVFGASPFVAKALVLLFGLAATIYLTLGLRRWLSPEAGWAGLLLLLQPSVILWSHAVMLNIPSMALGIATLWHLRRWMEEPASRHVYPALLLAFVGVLTYATTGVVVLISLAWIIAERRWVLLTDRRAWILAVVLVVLLVPWVFVVYRWAPAHLSTVYATSKSFWIPIRWTYYGKVLPQLFTTLLLGLAAFGAAVGFADRRYFRETKLAVLWAVVGYLTFSYIVAREPRYALILGPPAVILTAIGLTKLSQWAAGRLSVHSSRLFLGATAVLTVVHLWNASSVRVPRVEGFQEVVAYLKSVAPEEMVLYDGKYDGIFSFYVRQGDPNFKRGVVPGDKLLYASAIFPKWQLEQYVSSPHDVVERIQSKCGCRWLAIEQPDKEEQSDQVAAARYLREAVRGPEFDFIKSFPIAVSPPMHINIYRFRLPVKPPEFLELSFPALRDGGRFRVKPIHR